MITGNRSPIDALLSTAALLPKDSAKLAHLQEAVQLADACNDVSAAFQARLELIRAATFSGYPEKALVAFAWCLAQADKTPARFARHEFQLLWEYKWMLNDLSDFPEVTVTQIENA